MIYLILVTVLWAFSFSLIGVYLSGQVDAYFSVWIRIALALLLFLPFLKRKDASIKTVLAYTGIGSVQLGLMYVFYYKSFGLLSVPEVLVFTILTPVYVTLIHDAFEKHFNPLYLLSAFIAVAGAAVIRWGAIDAGFLNGFLVVQGANFCFAFGQVAYKRLKTTSMASLSPLNTFSWFYLGAFIVASILWLSLGQPKYPTEAHQWGILLWLGLGASGVGYFLWNYGATQVNAAVLAVMNNALIPAGLLVNLVLWNREIDTLRLTIGAVIIMIALWIGMKKPQNHASA